MSTLASQKLQEKIGKFLEEHQMSIGSFEKKYGIQINTVRRIMEGKTTNPSFETLQKLSVTLKCSFDQLLGLDEIQVPEEALDLPWNPQVHKEAVQLLARLLDERSIEMHEVEAFPVIETFCSRGRMSGAQTVDKVFADKVLDSQKLRPRGGRKGQKKNLPKQELQEDSF